MCLFLRGITARGAFQAETPGNVLMSQPGVPRNWSVLFGGHVTGMRNTTVVLRVTQKLREVTLPRRACCPMLSSSPHIPLPVLSGLSFLRLFCMEGQVGVYFLVSPSSFLIGRVINSSLSLCFSLSPNSMFGSPDSDYPPGQLHSTPLCSCSIVYPATLLCNYQLSKAAHISYYPGA